MGNSFIGKLSKGISNRFGGVFSNPYKELGLSWFDIKYLKHLPIGKERMIDFLQKKLYYRSPQELIHTIEEIFLQKMYEQNLIKTPYILDCGANIGLSVIYLKSLFPNAIIEAFEPDETNFALLQKNVVSFGLKNVELHKKAVWNENTFLQFSATGSTDSKIVLGQKNLDAIKVEAIRLKDFLVKKIDFLKIDIEGAEYQVLVDIAPELHYVQNLFLEYHGTFSQNLELINMMKIVHDAGFSFYIKEAASPYKKPFLKQKSFDNGFDLQLNIFCTR